VGEAPRFGLTHVAVPAPRFEETMAFYELLGARRGFTRTDGEGRPTLVQMMLGEGFVELIRSGADEVMRRGGHLALRTGDIAAAWALLSENGHPPKTPPRRGESGVMWFFVDDPSGNAVEIVAPVAAGEGEVR
jgi:catechol 2,3-dioxygenase-like lactoylglutathione lyase family enzyme